MFATLPPVLLLDLDDTILSYSARVDETWNAAIQLHATHLGDETMRRVMNEIIAARDWFWGDPARHRAGRLDLLESRRFIVREALRRTGAPDDTIGNKISDEYSTKRDQLLAPFPGAIDTLNEFRKRGIRLALITNGNQTIQRAKINRFDLASYFECIIVEGEFGLGKPEEAVFRHALSELNAAPHEAWMVGDNLEWDVAGPQRIGIAGIWIDIRGEGVPPGSSVKPDRIIRALSDLLEEPQAV